MAVTHVPSPCTDAGQHLLGAVIETYLDGRQRKECTGGCDEAFDVEPDADRIYADLIPWRKR